MSKFTNTSGGSIQSFPFFAVTGYRESQIAMGPKLNKPQTGEVDYPPMPEEKVIRALQHAFDEIGEENWKITAKAMPVVARHIATEAREHYYAPPKNFFNYYINTPLEVIKAKPDEKKDSDGIV